jgi:large subunit ribosomal protein L3
VARHHKPVAGSRAFWPKKRAKRIYPRVRAMSSEKEAKPLVFACYKAGMTQVVYLDTKKDSVTHGQKVVKAVTVLDAPPLVVAGIKTYKICHDGLLNADTILSEKISKDLHRKTKMPKNINTKQRVEKAESMLDKLSDVRLLVHTKPRESGIGKKKPELFEIDLSGDVKQKWEYAKQKLGSELHASDMFATGEWVDASAVTKGKGYQGPVKRFGVKIRIRKAKLKRRHIGSLGPRTPARVLPGKLAMAGQLGFQTRTEYGKKVLKIGSGGITPKGGFVNYGIVSGDYILLEGSVPGSKKRLIFLRKGVRIPKNRKEPVEVEDIVLESQQGV